MNYESILKKNINIDAYWFSDNKIIVIEFLDYIEKTNDVSDLYQMLEYVLSLINDKSVLLTCIFNQKNEINKELKNYKGILKFNQDPRKLEFIKLSYLDEKKYMIRELFKSSFKWEIYGHVFLFLSQTLIIYPHEDMWFGILDLWDNEPIINSILSRVDREKGIVFITWKKYIYDIMNWKVTYI